MKNKKISNHKKFKQVTKRLDQLAKKGWTLSKEKIKQMVNEVIESQNQGR